MTDERHSLGRWGEEAALAYLIKAGYTILARNYRTPHGELDIVARKEDSLFFVEVKTRATNDFAFPEQAVSYRKQLHMQSAAQVFLEKQSQHYTSWQFDVIAITKLGDAPAEIEHFENIIG